MLLLLLLRFVVRQFVLHDGRSFTHAASYLKRNEGVAGLCLERQIPSRSLNSDWGPDDGILRNRDPFRMRER
jgi:hypothetical protein